MILWLAQGMGLGRLPVAPGTFGSLGGLVFFILLLGSGDPLIYSVGTVGGVVLAIGLCGAAERILKQKDPGSIVLDELVALPLCFAGWVVWQTVASGRFPTANFFFSAELWPASLGVFALFRLFDIAKPWPVRQSQKFSGGWGVVLDDLAAALYVNAVVLAVLSVRAIFT